MKVKLLKKLRKKAKRMFWVEEINSTIYVVKEYFPFGNLNATGRVYDSAIQAVRECIILRRKYLLSMVYKRRENKTHKRIF